MKTLLAYTLSSLLAVVSATVVVAASAVWLAWLWLVFRRCWTWVLS